jgi:hypothetical protein
MSYIIKSGPGYFLYLRKYYSDEHLDMPYLTSKEEDATRLSLKDAKDVMEKLDALGWEAEIIKARKIKDE